MLLILSVTSFCQQTITAIPQLNNADYQKKLYYQQKSTHFKTAANIILGSGTAFSLIGLIIKKEGYLSADNSTIFGIISQGNTFSNAKEKQTYILSGVCIMLGSIPFYFISSSLKKKSLSLSFKNETGPQFYKHNIVSSSIPSFTLKLNL